jgi:hypothetical protein
MPCQYKKGSESSPLRDPARASDTDSAALEVCDASVAARTTHFTVQAYLDHETCDRAHRRERNGFHHGLLETFDLPVATRRGFLDVGNRNVAGHESQERPPGAEHSEKFLA